MDFNWYITFYAHQQTMKDRQAEAENYRLSRQIEKQPIRWSLPKPRLNQPDTASRPLRRVLS